MGRSNDAASLAAYCEALGAVWPDLSVAQFEAAMVYGLRKVTVYGKMTFPVICEFIRHWQANEEAIAEKKKRYNPNV